MARRKKSNGWVADFETTTNIDDCRVWGWSLVNIDNANSASNVEVGNSLDSFFERVSLFSEIVYFHNLKFDAGFIIDNLFRSGFKHTMDKPSPLEFSTLISNMGQFYSLTVCWENGVTTEFRDSLKKLPYSVEVIGKAFNLDVAKGEIDFKTLRPVGHELTDDEKHYMCMDVLVVAQALKLEFDNGMTRMTVGSDSLHEFKQLIGSNLFDRRFPVLSDSIDSDIRQSYRGGFAYADVRFKGKNLCNGSVYDVNSLYPSVMYNSLLPYGEPLYREGEPTPDDVYPLYIISITFTAKLKKNHIPCIQIKNNMHFSATEYLDEIKEVTTLSITNVDLELWEKHYDLNILSYNGGYYFKAAIGMFKSFIDKWMEIKATSVGGMRELAKLHLNSLY